jgi:thioesterase domain-containing protein
VAQQLRAQGQEIALLILLEVLHPVKMKEYPAWKWHITSMQLKLHLLKFEYAYLRQVKGAQAFSYLKERFSRKMSEIKHFLMGPLRFSKNGKNPSGSINPLDILYSAASNYCPKPYPGPAVLFRCKDQTFGFAQDPRLGWGDTLGPDLQICTTPGNHYTFYVEPNVKILAREMNARMRKAEERLNDRGEREAVKSDFRARNDSASNRADFDPAVLVENRNLEIREGKVAP